MVVIGNSALVLGFLTSANKPSKGTLITIVHNMRNIVHCGSLSKEYVLVPRAQNWLADFLCN